MYTRLADSAISADSFPVVLNSDHFHCGRQLLARPACSICRLQYPERQSHRQLLAASSRQRVREVSQPSGEASPSDLDVHIILDNYSAHKSATVQRWLKSKKHRHFYFHFIPTSSSWLNQVERFFALITERMIRRGTFRSVEELERAIYAWLANWNNKPQPFVWKATTDVILDKVRRCKELAGTPH
jgi:transposase